MRITAEAKQATRRRILKSARKLFASKGFEATTTRDVARASDIATGTLFNYFPTKEAIVMTLVAEALQRAQDEFDPERRGDASLEEELFAHVAAGLRKLTPYRTFLQPAMESALSPTAQASGNEVAECVRLDHLQTVERILADHGMADAASPTAWHLYWTLYTGVLAFWTSDPSPKQEDTLALLDQSLRMFVDWLRQNKPGF